MTSSVHRTVRAYWVGDIFCGVKRTQSHKGTKTQSHKDNSQSLPDPYNKIPNGISRTVRHTTVNPKP